ncbi:hypothetical protein EXS73_03650 [Candidatus Pacearchaeota archaeon]|nr:hypothetical protein [Candidatus Pacearchaeota archaeon]
MERELRSYRRVAYNFHFCDRCCQHIQPGQEYEGRVVVTERGRLMVWKTHRYPSCDFPEEPEDTKEKGLEGVVIAFPAGELKIAA